MNGKMNNMVKLLSKQISVGSSSTSTVSVACCNICEGDHNTNICVERGQVQFVNNYNQIPQNSPYSNTYNSRWKNHLKFGWKGQGIQQRPNNPLKFQSKQSNVENKLAWEIAIERLANVSNDKIDKLASATNKRF